MDHQVIFKIVNAIALISWIILIVFPFRPWIIKSLFTIIIGGLALFYTTILLSSISLEDMENFNSLEGVMALFTDPQAVLAGWIHYLAFDLMVGMYIVHQAKINHIRKWVIMPSLVLTFMAGPFGLVLFMTIRGIQTRTLLQDYQ